MTLRRLDRDDVVLWVCDLNGVNVQYMTQDKGRVLHEEGIADGTRVGVRLVDDDGKTAAVAWER